MICDNEERSTRFASIVIDLITIQSSYTWHLKQCSWFILINILLWICDQVKAENFVERIMCIKHTCFHALTKTFYRFNGDISNQMQSFINYVQWAKMKFNEKKSFNPLNATHRQLF